MWRFTRWLSQRHVLHRKGFEKCTFVHTSTCRDPLISPRCFSPERRPQLDTSWLLRLSSPFTPPPLVSGYLKHTKKDGGLRLAHVNERISSSFFPSSSTRSHHFYIISQLFTLPSLYSWFPGSPFPSCALHPSPPASALSPLASRLPPSASFTSCPWHASVRPEWRHDPLSLQMDLHFIYLFIFSCVCLCLCGWRYGMRGSRIPISFHTAEGWRDLTRPSVVRKGGEEEEREK